MLFRSLEKEHVKLDQTRTQANMLAAFPLTTARDRHWWSHCGIPWGRQTHQQVSSQDHSKKGQWTCRTHQWSQLALVVSGNCFGGHDIFGILRPQLLWPAL